MRCVDHDDPNIALIGHLQASCTATLAYLLGEAALEDLFALQEMLSQIAMQTIAAQHQRDQAQKESRVQGPSFAGSVDPWMPSLGLSLEEQQRRNEMQRQPGQPQQYGEQSCNTF